MSGDLLDKVVTEDEDEMFEDASDTGDRFILHIHTRVLLLISNLRIMMKHLIGQSIRLTLTNCQKMRGKPWFWVYA